MKRRGHSRILCSLRTCSHNVCSHSLFLIIDRLGARLPRPFSQRLCAPVLVSCSLRRVLQLSPADALLAIGWVATDSGSTGDRFSGHVDYWNHDAGKTVLIEFFYGSPGD